MTKIRNPSIYSILSSSHITRWFFTIVIPTFCITFMITSLTLYLNFDHVINLFMFIFSPPVVVGIKRVTVVLPPIKRGLSIYDRNISYKDFNYLNSTTLSYKKRIYSGNVPILFRLPNKVPIKALLLIFHGCSRTAHDWFHTIERQRIIGAAIDFGYGCLAFQATNELTRCWTSNADIFENDDIQMVFKGLEGFYKSYPKLESLPRFTFGSSSGGIFSSIFVTNQRYKIQGQILFISIILPEVLDTFVKTKTYPPTAWIYMSRDTEFASEERINASIRVFDRENIPYKSFSIEPIILTSTTCHERIPTITKDASSYIFYRLQQNRWLDSQNNLIYNPRRKDEWGTFLFIPINKTHETINILDNLNKNKHLLPDFFNTIYGEHEISFERSFEALLWHKQLYFNRSQTIVS